MATIVKPYPKLPGSGTEKASSVYQKVRESLFAVIRHDQSCKISTLMISTYFGCKTLILTNDVESFTDLPQYRDPMECLMPVEVFHRVQIYCARALADAITNHGYKMANSPSFVPLQITTCTRDCQQDYINVDLPKQNQLLLAHAIVNNVHMKIGEVCVSKMSSTWKAPPEKPL